MESASVRQSASTRSTNQPSNLLCSFTHAMAPWFSELLCVVPCIVPGRDGGPSKQPTADQTRDKLSAFLPLRYLCAMGWKVQYGRVLIIAAEQGARLPSASSSHSFPLDSVCARQPAPNPTEGKYLSTCTLMHDTHSTMEKSMDAIVLAMFPATLVNSGQIMHQYDSVETRKVRTERKAQETEQQQSK